MKNKIIKAILAGVLIALAGILYLNCENKVIGALLFSIGLISVIILQADLYTGKVGYVKSKQDILDLAIMLLFNVVSAYIVGLLYKSGNGSVSIMEIKVEKDLWKAFLDSVGCGMLIYLAVELYKKTKSLLPVVLGVMGFIIVGFEHCIANSFYIGASDPELIHFGYLLIYIVGNSIGSLIIRLLQRGWKMNEVSKSE
jgi:formate/nitrite transporter FocA (FNT family)